MRKTKFRFWNKLEKKMHEDVCCCSDDGDTNELIKNLQNNYILMQYTGLKDSKGVKIFEGDILIDGFKRWFVVFWREEDAGFWIRKYNEVEVYQLNKSVSNKKDKMFEKKIIGNIYENKNLLKEN